MNQTKLEEMSSFFNARADHYDTHHLNGIDGGIESKQILASFLPASVETLLDFGVGTGLELDEIIKKFPNIQVTGIDISENMLKKIETRFPGDKIRLFCGDYLIMDFEENYYDAVLSSMTLHHYTHEVKLALYQKIYKSLAKGGVYIENDFMLSEYEFDDPQKQEDNLFSEYQRQKSEQHLSDETYYHFDTPCTVANQKKLLQLAGFYPVEEVWRLKNNVTLLARKNMP